MDMNILNDVLADMGIKTLTPQDIKNIANEE